MVAYGYIRIASLTQVTESESLINQKNLVEIYASQIGLSVGHYFIEEGVSVSIPLEDRAAGNHLLAVVKRGDVVLTPTLDRMFESSLDALRVLAKLKSCEVRLHVVDMKADITSDGISKLLFPVLSMVAQIERHQAYDRPSGMHKHQKKNRQYLGGKVPFGYEVGSKGELIEIVAQQQAIREMIQLKAEGRSLRSISEIMKARGHMVSHVAVKNIIQRLTSGTA